MIEDDQYRGIFSSIGNIVNSISIEPIEMDDKKRIR